MQKDRTRNKWLLLAVAAAIALSNPFLAVAVGSSLSLIFLCCDSRSAVRKYSAPALLVLAAAALWADPLTACFALVSALTAVWTLRENFFSSVTSSAIVGSLVGAIVTAAVVVQANPESWRQIETETAVTQQHWRELAGGRDKADIEQEIAWERMTRLVVRIIPGQLALMMIASFFLSVILFRRFGDSKLHLSLGSTQFNQYRFEDNWIWIVIAGLILWLLFGHNETLLRIALNLLFVMGSLYVIRGLSIMFFFVARRGGGVILRVLLVVLCLTPVVIVHLVFGILDTWMDFRKSVPAAG
ncbi:MAG: DUF2232 domain-containing protein [Candidatus Glassbacteria bacterium]